MFSSFGGSLSHEDIIWLDGAFAVAHVNYGKSPMFDGASGREIARESRKGSLSSEDKIDDVLGRIRTFDGTETGFSDSDREEVWRYFWLEYVHAFDVLATQLPDSVATAFIGRHAIELGLKYLLLVRAGSFSKTHNIGQLARELCEGLAPAEGYMDCVVDYCELYGQFTEGGNAEYFRFPEYRQDAYFAGNRLDIHWLSYNCALVLLKLLHLAGLDGEG